MLQSRGSGTIKACGGRCGSIFLGVLCVWRAVPGQKITSADGAVAHVSRLAGAQVSSDGVGADGVFVTQILSTGALVMFCRKERERDSGELWMQSTRGGNSLLVFGLIFF